MQNSLILRKHPAKDMSISSSHNGSEPLVPRTKQSTDALHKESVTLDTAQKLAPPHLCSSSTCLRPSFVKEIVGEDVRKRTGGLFPKDVQSLSDYRVHENKRVKAMASAQLPYLFIEGEGKVVPVSKKKVAVALSSYVG